MTYSEIFTNISFPYFTGFEKVCDNSYIISLRGKDNIWNIKLNLLDDFPFSVPRAYLLNEDLIGKLPHVDENGFICLIETDSILINYKEESLIIEAFIEGIYNLLERVRLKIYKDELTDEFEGYFSNDLKYVNSFYFAKNEIEKIALRISKEDYSFSYKPILLHSDTLSFPKNFSDINKISNQKVNILHIPLEFAILPPSKNQLLNIYDYIKVLHKNIPIEFKEFIDKFINRKKTYRNNFYILFSMPRSSGERTQFLIHYYSKVKTSHPLISIDTDFDINLYFLNRNNETYLKERGGSSNNFSSKSVSIIGCGSVGGEIAMMLAKSGVGELTLIDPDVLKQDNIFRHRLGGGSLSYLPNEKLKIPMYSKVSLLEYQITKDIPYIKVNPRSKYFNKLLNDEKLLSSDIVIVAVGSPMVSLEINAKLKELGLKNVIFCWNEADSIGGHSVALNLEESCFECLYIDDKGFSLNNELSFVEAGQSISKNITGCGGVFTPFSYIDSSQTAILSSRQCLEMLTNNLHSQALSWKTSSSVNLKVTHRFDESSLQEVKCLESKSKCRVCNE